MEMIYLSECYNSHVCYLSVFTVFNDTDHSRTDKKSNSMATIVKSDGRFLTTNIYILIVN